MIEISKLTKTYDRGTKALKDVNITIDDGEFVFITGRSGSGKSTLIKILLKEVEPTSGRVVVNDMDLRKMPRRYVPKYRRRLGVVFQDFRLLKDKTVYENVAFAQRVIGESSRTIRESVPQMLKMVGLSSKYKFFPHQLSGGMCQRVMIAMAMSCEPELLIADEPTTALDVTIQAQILELMEDIRAKKNTGILMITHDLGVVAEMCSRVVVMYAGRIVEEAPVQELFADPKHPYTQGLIGSVPKLGSGVESLPSIPGSVPDLSVMPKGCKFAPRCKYAMDICHQQEPELADINEAGTRKCRCHLLNKTGKEA